MKYKLIALLLMAATINSCGAGTSQKANAQSAENETKVLIKTTAGDITVKLYNETPQHRDNFIKLVQEHFYQLDLNQVYFQFLFSKMVFWVCSNLYLLLNIDLVLDSLLNYIILSFLLFLFYMPGLYYD